MTTLIITILSFSMGLASAQNGGLIRTTTYTPANCDQLRKSQAGDKLSMHYTGSIDESSKTGARGYVFDSSVPRREPFDFILGQGEVIRGWDQGLLGMCPGEKRTLIIPPHLGYGENGAGKDIPGGATLKFEVECLSVTDAPPREPEPNIFVQIDKNSDSKITKEEMLSWFQDEKNVNDIPQGLWENEDKNRDGVVTYEEFSGPKGERDEL